MCGLRLFEKGLNLPIMGDSSSRGIGKLCDAKFCDTHEFKFRIYCLSFFHCCNSET